MNAYVFWTLKEGEGDGIGNEITYFWKGALEDGEEKIIKQGRKIVFWCYADEDLQLPKGYIDLNKEGNEI